MNNDTPTLNIGRFDPVTDTIMIEGTTFSGTLFREGFGVSAMLGQVVRIDKHENGVLTVTRLREFEVPNAKVHRKHAARRTQMSSAQSGGGLFWCNALLGWIFRDKERDERIERFKALCRENEETQLLFAKYHEQALKVSIDLNMAGVPCISPQRVFLADAEWVDAMRKKGFMMFEGLRLLKPN